MAKMYKSLFYLLFACLVLVNCTGEDGEPGPAGEQGVAGEKGDQGEAGEAGLDAVTKIGTLEGKITGTRKDGTAFEYPFSYEYTYGNSFGFRENTLSIDRFTVTPFRDYAGFDLQKSNGTLIPLNPNYSASFQFRKELNATTLFSLEAEASFRDFAGEYRPISQANNGPFGFSQYGRYIYATTYAGQDAYYLDAYLNNVGYTVYYKRSTGVLLGLYDYYNNQTITSGTTYNKFNEVKLTFDALTNKYKFVNIATNASMEEEIPAVPADKLTITNYAHNTTTGVLSFDFKLEISKYLVASRVNSTQHDLVIEGKYNSGSKVYENTVGRKK